MIKAIIHGVYKETTWKIESIATLINELQLIIGDKVEVSISGLRPHLLVLNQPVAQDYMGKTAQVDIGGIDRNELTSDQWHKIGKLFLTFLSQIGKKEVVLTSVNTTEMWKGQAKKKLL